MPRLAPSLLHYAGRKNPLLPILLRECRDTQSAENELRWLTEHALARQSSPRARAETLQRSDVASTPGWRTTLRKLVRRRARGEPLQYILGTQPFGDLEILCQKGVLIPRLETEAYTAELAGLVRDLGRAGPETKRQKLRILDLCTGTGCISLLLHSLLRPPNIESGSPKGGLNESFLEAGVDILGIDISTTALELAKSNLQHNVEQGTLHWSARHEVSFVQADVLKMPVRNTTIQLDSAPHSENERADTATGVIVPSPWDLLQRGRLSKDWDVLIANPPYISPRDFSPGGTTTRSVRRWEPQLALVPRLLRSSISQHAERPEHENQLERGDEFYPPLLQLAQAVDAKAVVLEIGGNKQALRVRKMAAQCFAGEPDVVVEVWRDDGTVNQCASDDDDKGLGNECRSVVVWRSSWVKQRSSSTYSRKQRH